MLPVRRLRIFACTNPRRFPGVRCATLKTEYNSLLYLMTIPGRICVAEIMTFQYSRGPRAGWYAPALRALKDGHSRLSGALPSALRQTRLPLRRGRQPSVLHTHLHGGRQEACRVVPIEWIYAVRPA